MQQQQTGTRNETYDLISVLYHALQGAENCQTYLNDAQDGQVRDFLEQALQSQRQLADRAKEVLQQSLQKDTGGRSAFGWGSASGTDQNQRATSGAGSSQGGHGSNM
jgi:hypothetical protein